VTSDYIHGYSRREQQRLVGQARVLAPHVFAGLDLGTGGRLLEIGCGVGAELDLIHRQWPGLTLTGIDRSAHHLAAAHDRLASAIAEDRVRLVHGKAERLPFATGCFDRVMTVWLLEHVADPTRVLAEALRVLAPDGELICTEVDNRCFGFTPARPAIAAWWRYLNACQADAGGHPFIGGHLYRIAKDLGARRIATETIAVIASQLDPARRALQLDYLEDLLLSAAPSLAAAQLVGGGDIAALKADFAAARADETIEFRYFAVRLRCQTPR
jgi:ubiquinone/menaquinone biosynthesis C-methylase UbiE